MKCELCGEREASIHVRQIVGNEVTDVHLCEICATEKGITSSNNKIEVSLSQLLTGLVDTTEEKAKEADELECPRCGLSYAEFRKEGRTGCAECYEAFHEQVKAMVSGMGGGVQHRGKYPTKVLQYKTFLIDREKLKERLQQSVRDEDYETAAMLRDRIRDLETAAEDDDEEL